MGNGKRALVVDDDPATVALFRKILTADQWEVDTADSGREASTKIRPGHYDLVISDLYMPDVNGVELYEAAIQTDPNLQRRFLFVSGYTDSSSVKAFLLETGCPGLRKPIRLDEFREVIAHLADAKPLSGATLPAPWFTPDSQYLYSGEITGRHTLFSLLNRIYAARLTGVLQLMLGRVEKKLYFNYGNLIFASSDLPGDGLGELMLRAGALTQAGFEEATARMEKGQRFGFALVDLGICDMTQLAEWVRRQVTEIANSVFEYSAGRYYFFDSFEENIVPEVGIAVPLGHLLLAAVRQASDLPLAELAHDENLRVDLSPDPLMCFQAVGLNENERAVLATVVQPMRAADLIRASGLARAEATRALYALLALGMVIAVPPEAKQTRAGPAIVAEPEAVTHEAAPAAGEAAEQEEFRREMKKLLEVAEAGTYYQLLEVTPNSAPSQIRQNFYKLARRFHPDRHMGRSEWIGSLQKLMDALSLAYKTLSDQRLRENYDKRLAESGAFTLGREKTEKQGTAEECLETAKECLRAKNYAGSVLWLRKCVEIAPNDSKYRAMLARSLAAVPQYRREAIEHFEKAIQLDPWNISAYFQFAELFEEMQLPWRARPLYLKILDIDPEHTKARERLRQLDIKEGKKGERDTFLGRLFSRKAR